MSHARSDFVLCVAGGLDGFDGWRDRLLEGQAGDVEVVVLEAGAAGSRSLAGVCAAGGRHVIVALAPMACSPGWIERLLAEAGPAVGTVSALPVGLEPTPSAADEIAGLTGTDGPLARTLVAPAGPLVVLTASAVGLVGPPVAEASDPAAAVMEFAERCSARALSHLVAMSTPVAGARLEDRDAGGEDPIGRVTARVRRRAEGMTVTLDARSLNEGAAGTQVHIVELAAALAQRVRLRVVLPHDPSAWASEALELLDGVQMQTYDEVITRPEPTDVVHRPLQAFDLHDIALLRTLGRRLVVTHQDELLYRNAGYFGSPAEWQEYRRTGRLVLAWVDRVVFFTEHARTEALRDEVVEADQAVVVPIGARRTLTAMRVEPRPPAGLTPAVTDGSFLLMLGTDLAHKNRPFAIAVAAALRRRHGWDGSLVLAGPQVRFGSSRHEEDRLLAETDLPVIRLERVSEQERAWLMQTCDAVMFPSVDEGFGLIPFEAADAGKPCLFAATGPLTETLPVAEASLVPWDADASADAVAALLRDPACRAHHVEQLGLAADRYSWAQTAARMHSIYEDVASRPARPVSRANAELAKGHRELSDIVDAVGPDGLGLVGDGGTIPPAMRRPMLAATSRAWFARPLFSLVRLLYRAARPSR